MSAIKVKNLTKNFKYHTKEEGLKNSIKNLFTRKKLIKTAVSEISFEIEEGEIVGFLGPNGAGKTTTLKMLSGIMHPSSGHAEVLGFVPWNRQKDFKKIFSIVLGQKNQLWWDLPANESFNLNKYIYELNDKDYRKTVDELSNLLDVKNLLNVQVRNLSLGERMKMELIAALIHHPKVLFLDEPTIGLDIISQKNIREFLKFYNKESRTTIILTSHYMKDIEDLCKRTVVINQGKIVYDGELCRIDDDLSRKKLMKLEFSKPVDRSAISHYGTVREFSEMAVTLEVDRYELKKHSNIILNDFDVLDFNIEDIPIEESIATLYKKGGEENA